MSLDNFFNIQSKTPENIKLSNNSSILFYRLTDLQKSDDSINFEKIFQSIPWVQPVVAMYGKTFKPKRQVATMGKPYNYNGNNSKKETPIPKIIQTIMNKVNDITKKDYNTCIANYYPNGEAYICMHDDGEENSESIASVSFGATRKFVVQNKSTKEKHFIELKDLDIIVMEGNKFQRDYLHGIPKQVKVKEPRISLTFRNY